MGKPGRTGSLRQRASTSYGKTIEKEPKSAQISRASARKSAAADEHGSAEGAAEMERGSDEHPRDHDDGVESRLPRQRHENVESPLGSSIVQSLGSPIPNGHREFERESAGNPRGIDVSAAAAAVQAAAGGSQRAILPRNEEVYQHSQQFPRRRRKRGRNDFPDDHREKRALFHHLFQERGRAAAESRQSQTTVPGLGRFRWERTNYCVRACVRACVSVCSRVPVPVVLCLLKFTDAIRELIKNVFPKCLPVKHNYFPTHRFL